MLPPGSRSSDTTAGIAVVHLVPAPWVLRESPGVLFQSTSLGLDHDEVIREIAARVMPACAIQAYPRTGAEVSFHSSKPLMAALIRFSLVRLPFAELVPPYLPGVGLWQGTDKLNRPRVLVRGGHRPDVLLKTGDELF